MANPVRMEGRPGDNPHGGSEPFNPVELEKLRENATDDLLPFLLFVGLDYAVPTLSPSHGKKLISANEKSKGLRKSGKRK